MKKEEKANQDRKKKAEINLRNISEGLREKEKAENNGIVEEKKRKNKEKGLKAPFIDVLKTYGFNKKDLPVHKKLSNGRNANQPVDLDEAMDNHNAAEGVSVNDNATATLKESIEKLVAFAEEGNVSKINEFNNQLISQFSSDLKENVFLNAVMNCAINGNEKALKVLAKNYPKTTEKGLSAAMLHFANLGNKKVLNIVVNNCPKTLKVNVLSNVIGFCAKEENEKALKMVAIACPRKQKGEVFLNAKKICDNELLNRLVNEFKPVNLDDGIVENNAKQVFSVDTVDEDIATPLIDHDTKTTELLGYASEGNINKAFRLGRSLPFSLRAKIFAKAMIICAKEGKEEALNAVKTACISNSKLMIFSHAMRICAENGDKETLEVIKRECPDDIKVKMFSNAMVVCAMQGNIKAFELLVSACPKELEVTIIAEAMSSCAKIGTKEAFDSIKEAGPEDSQASKFGLAMANCVMNGVNMEAFNRIANVCPPELEIENFAAAMVKCALDDNRFAVQLLGHESPKDKKKEIFALTMAICANLSDRKVFEMVNKYCPFELTDDTFSNLKKILAK